ncbi:MAG: phage holin family protein [Balneola sp.]|mmetsp:Transcript_4036/g.6346  ORF Transcript_4036/g.6346 Transcript_4036/m.6346 type:complete len:136 (-) Transcript_4036:353-760(-)
MDQLGQRIKQVSNELKGYVETRIELLILNLSDKGTLWLGDLIQHTFNLVILGTGLLFGLIALGFYLGELLNSMPAGFGIIGVLLFLLGLILMIAKPKNVSRKIQAQIMKDVIDALESKKDHQNINFLEEKKSEEQ